MRSAVLQELQRPRVVLDATRDAEELDRPAEAVRMDQSPIDAGAVDFDGRPAVATDGCTDGLHLTVDRLALGGADNHQGIDRPGL